MHNHSGSKKGFPGYSQSQRPPRVNPSATGLTTGTPLAIETSVRMMIVMVIHPARTLRHRSVFARGCYAGLPSEPFSWLGPRYLVKRKVILNNGARVPGYP